MTRTQLLTALAAALLAAPALAQTPPPPPAGEAGASAPGQGTGMKGGMHGGRGHHGKRALSGLSPEGQQTMREAMRAGREDSNRDEVRAARDRVSAILAADTLDVPALRRAMEAERKLVDAQHKARQERMLAAFQKLSTADRKAFVASATEGRERMRARLREQMEMRSMQRAPTS